MPFRQGNGLTPQPLVVPRSSRGRAALASSKAGNCLISTQHAQWDESRPGKEELHNIPQITKVKESNEKTWSG